jgi:hypothetical protein
MGQQLNPPARHPARCDSNPAENPCECVHELCEGGAATLQSLDPVEYVIPLNAPRYLHAEKRIVLGEDEQASLTIAMSQVSVARVQVVDVAGGPIARRSTARSEAASRSNFASPKSQCGRTCARRSVSRR